MGSMSWRSWWARVAGPTWRIVTQVDAADEVPDELPSGGVVLVQSTDLAKWLVFDCPCGRGHRVLLNLDPGRWPHWRFSHTDALTVWPSIDVESSGRRCHYIVRRGRVIWIPERSVTHARDGRPQPLRSRH
jgi:hypothetical protein